jgi:hypothetical protein
LDPQKDLAPGFCDPIQITDKDYNDSAIWVDFTKDEVPRHFRLGVFGELKAWNPSNLAPDKNPDFLRRLVVVERPPFTRETWTHVVVTWSDLGSERGISALYLNGKLVSNSTANSRAVCVGWFKGGDSAGGELHRVGWTNSRCSIAL